MAEAEERGIHSAGTPDAPRLPRTKTCGRRSGMNSALLRSIARPDSVALRNSGEVLLQPAARSAPRFVRPLPRSRRCATPCQRRVANWRAHKSCPTIGTRLGLLAHSSSPQGERTSTVLSPRLRRRTSAEHRLGSVLRQMATGRSGDRRSVHWQPPVPLLMVFSPRRSCGWWPRFPPVACASFPPARRPCRWWWRWNWRCRW